MRTLSLTRKSGKHSSPARKGAKGASTRTAAAAIGPIDERWQQDIIVLRRAAEELSRRRTNHPYRRRTDETSFRDISALLEDESPVTRQWAVRKLYELDADLAATRVNYALKDGSPQHRRNIGTALADSGLLFEAIDDLMAENHERCYGAFSLLFLVAKAGVVQPLLSVIENHPNIDLRLAVIRLLASSKEMQVVSALQGIANNATLPPELRSATLKAISQITGQRLCLDKVRTETR
jgi:HEAT repeat protein